MANIAADISPGTIGNDVDLLGMDTAIWEKTISETDITGAEALIKLTH